MKPPPNSSIRSGHPSVWITVPAFSAIGRHLPQFLDPNRELLRLTAVRQRQPAQQRFRQVPAHAIAKIVTFARMSTPGSKRALRVHRSCRCPCHRFGRPLTAIALEQHLDAGESDKQVDSLRFDQAREPLGKLVQRDDVVAVVAQRRRRDRQRSGMSAGGSRRRSSCTADSRGAPFSRKVGDQFRAAPTDRARRPRACGRRLRGPSRAPQSRAVRPRCSLQLCEPQRRRQARGTAADDEHVYVERLPIHGLLCAREPR